MARLRSRHLVAAVSAASLSAAALSVAGPAQIALASGATLYAVRTRERGFALQLPEDERILRSVFARPRTG